MKKRELRKQLQKTSALYEEEAASNALLHEKLQAALEKNRQLNAKITIAPGVVFEGEIGQTRYRAVWTPDPLRWALCGNDVLDQTFLKIEWFGGLDAMGAESWRDDDRSSSRGREINHVLFRIVLELLARQTGHNNNREIPGEILGARHVNQ